MVFVEEFGEVLARLWIIHTFKYDCMGFQYKDLYNLVFVCVVVIGVKQGVVWIVFQTRNIVRYQEDIAFLRERKTQE